MPRSPISDHALISNIIIVPLFNTLMFNTPKLLPIKGKSLVVPGMFIGSKTIQQYQNVATN